MRVKQQLNWSVEFGQHCHRVRFSFWLDFFILFLTIFQLISRTQILMHLPQIIQENIHFSCLALDKLGVNSLRNMVYHCGPGLGLEMANKYTKPFLFMKWLFIYCVMQIRRRGLPVTVTVLQSTVQFYMKLHERFEKPVEYG